MELIEGLFAFVFVLICFVIWLVPIVLIASSDRTEGKEKVAWILAVIFVSWFAWVFYWLLAPIKRRDNAAYRYR